MSEKIHIYEEATNLFWGLITLVSTTLATYILANSLVTDGWSFTSLNQIFALLLFSLSFVGILKISDPLYHFIFSVEKQVLYIEIKKGEQHIDTSEIPLSDISSLKFSPFTPRSSKEALFDFSANYQLMWKARDESEYAQLIDLGDVSFTLKVEDIAKVIRFIRKHDTDIHVPAEQGKYFGI